jgi:hypothetical protein
LRQHPRFNGVMRQLLLILSLCVVAGCAHPERTTSHADWTKEATRRWAGESKARVIAAAEAVVKHADPADTKLEYNRSGFTARRKFFIYAVIAAANGEDRWTFSASENLEGASAAVRIIQRGTTVAGQASQNFRDNQTMIGSLRLFYARLDYMLGKRPDWITCSEAVAKLALPREAPGLQSLCSITHQGSDAPAPNKLEARMSKVKAGNSGPPEPPQLAIEETD